MRVTLCLLLAAFVGRSAAAGCNRDADWDTDTYMCNFVHSDPEFDLNIREITTYNYSTLGCDTIILQFDSGPWLDENTTSHTNWWHYLAIHVPTDVPIEYTDAAFLFIDGGGMGGPPDQDDIFITAMCELAVDTGTITGVLKQIPNQCITFNDDPIQDCRSEDNLIAYTWSRFIELHDDPADYVETDYEQILQFPMARAVSKAFDVMNIWTTANVVDYNMDLQRFATSGGSKRGWAAWLGAMCDSRVVVTVPMVISVLNFTTNLHSHYENLGGWTWAFFDYWSKNITLYIDDPQTQMLLDEIDPLCYNSRLTLPKYLVQGTGDEFFNPDDSHDFWDDMLEPKRFMMMEGAEHSLVGSYVRTLNAMQNFWRLYLLGISYPSLTWTFEYDDGTPETGGLITATTDSPDVIDFWAPQCDTDPHGRRDFRVLVGDRGNITQFCRWNETEGVTYDNGQSGEDYWYSAHYPGSPDPDTTYRAFLVNVLFSTVEGRELDYTTEVMILPNNRPFPPCAFEECRGTLV